MVPSLAKARLHPWEGHEVVSCEPAAAVGVKHNWSWLEGGGISGPDSYSQLYATVSLEREIGEGWGAVARPIIRGIKVCLIFTHCRNFECCTLFSKLISADTVSH
jgi:hypothetical protein